MQCRVNILEVIGDYGLTAAKKLLFSLLFLFGIGAIAWIGLVVLALVLQAIPIIGPLLILLLGIVVGAIIIGLSWIFISLYPFSDLTFKEALAWARNNIKSLVVGFLVAFLVVGAAYGALYIVSLILQLLEYLPFGDILLTIVSFALMALYTALVGPFPPYLLLGLEKGQKIGSILKKYLTFLKENFLSLLIWGAIIEGVLFFLGIGYLVSAMPEGGNIDEEQILALILVLLGAGFILSIFSIWIFGLYAREGVKKCL